MAGRKSKKRVLTEWGLLIGALLMLNFTGYGKEAQAWLQRGILWTGLITPNIQYAEEHDVLANFDLSLVSLDGESASLEDFRGKVIFMNLWATWCPPCMAEMPFIQKLYDDMSDEGVAFVMISADDTAEIARKYIDAKGFTFPVYQLTGRMPEPYTSNVLPTTYVISPEGRLGTVHTGMANYDTDEFKAFLRRMADES
ncbi:MAG: TlpA family protein disulfide reductase [Bacteroidetes bacterium]|nr:TlpA family protein disulfide reductase [Bacteroidota bacterium]